MRKQEINSLHKALNVFQTLHEVRKINEYSNLILTIQWHCYFQTKWRGFKFIKSLLRFQKKF